MKKRSLLLVLAASALLVGCGGSQPASSSSEASSASSSPIEILTSSGEESSISSFTPMEGEGTKESPYIIMTPEQLVEVSNRYYSSTTAIEENDYYALGADLDMSGVEEFIPIGLDVNVPFKGVFDGNDHTIYGLNIVSDYLTMDGDRYELAGLFGLVDGAAIHNLTLDGTKVTNFSTGVQSFTGAVVAYSAGLMINYVEALNTTISVMESESEIYSFTGGLVGYYASNQAGSIYSLSSLGFSGEINDENPNSTVGGILGITSTYYGNRGALSLNNSYVKATEIRGGQTAGGLIGSTDFYVSASSVYVTAESIVVTATGGAYAGGIFGVGDYETFVKDAMIDVKLIQAPKSKSSYKSYVGTAIGYATPNEWDDGEGFLYDLSFGSGYENVYAIQGELKNADHLGENDGKIHMVSSFDENTYESVGLNSFMWVIGPKGPELTKVESVVDFTNTVKLENGEEDISVVSSTDTLSLNLLSTIDEPSKSGHIFSNFTYGEDGEFYRFYVASFTEVTLVAQWTDGSLLAGYYTGEVKYATGETWPVNPGTFEVYDNGQFVWTRAVDGSKQYGSFLIYGNAFVIRIDAEDTSYTYDGVWGLWSEGAFQFNDTNDSSYTYYWTRGKTIEITEESFYGTWEDNTGNHLILAPEGKAQYVDSLGTSSNLTWSFLDNAITITGYFGGYSIESVDIVDMTTLVLHTLYDEMTEFDFTFTKKNSVTVDYTYLGIGGVWYASSHPNYKFTADTSGGFSIDYFRSGTSHVDNGTYSDLGNGFVNFYSYGAFSNTNLQIDKNNGVMYGVLGSGAEKDYGEVVFAHTPNIGTFTGDDGVVVYAYEGQNVVFDNRLYVPNAVVSGSFAEGSTITVTIGSNVTSYTVGMPDYYKDGTLTKSGSGPVTSSEETSSEEVISSEESVSSSEESVSSSQSTVAANPYGTWTIEGLTYSNTLAIKSDLSGSFRGTSATWTKASDYVFKIAYLGDTENIIFTYNPSTDSATLHYEWDYTDYDFTCHR
ncbi:MAG: hypothetical protein K5694_01655 [Bacilli bacterium]|nr:hypothetical protein [Bacilli bacterium]